MTSRQPPLGVAGLIALARHAVAWAFLAFGAVCLLVSGQSLAQNAYITNLHSSTVPVIDATTDLVTAIIPVGDGPFGVAVTTDSSKVYITSFGPAYCPGPVSVTNAATNTVIDTIPVGNEPVAFGLLIQSVTSSAGMPGSPHGPDCNPAALTAPPGDCASGTRGLTGLARRYGHCNTPALQNAA